MAKRKKAVDPIIGVIDSETDPFLYGREPESFAWGVRLPGVYVEFWGEHAWRAMCQWIREYPDPLILYAHNGGKFDFFFMFEELENPVTLINSRIVSAKLGKHELRDSWAILPFPLAAYNKTKIDYTLFEREVRNLHRPLISNYLHDDCNDLYALVSAFVGRFGPRLTVAGTAMKELIKFHPQENTHESHDGKYRDYYFGGRVECFESGIVRPARGKRWKVFDVNGMYPGVMRDFDHPIGKQYLSLSSPVLDDAGWIRDYPGAMYFAQVEGENMGALPTRGDFGNGGLRFDSREGIFFTTSHELRTAIELGKFRVSRVIEAHIPLHVQTFDTFVDNFAAEKEAADKAGDKIGRMFAKLMLNSAYGKFGQNPEHFKEYHVQIRGLHMAPEDKPEPVRGTYEHAEWERTKWKLEKSAENWLIWSKPSARKHYYDVAIAASVTSAARAVLMRGIAGAQRPIYCDTDSIICEDLHGVKFGDFALGAWKLEAIGDECAIAGKKLYALSLDGTPVKWASKGVKLAPEAIRKVAQGGVVLWQSDAPNFSLTGVTKFVARRAKMTA